MGPGWQGEHIRTVPKADWVRVELNDWLSSARIDRGKIFRKISHTGHVWGDGISEKAVWRIVRDADSKIGVTALAPHDLRRYAEFRIMPNPSEWALTAEFVQT